MGVKGRIGVLGGTFDPIHNGHLVAAQEAAWALDLDRVLFVPAYRQPLKGAEPAGGAQHRVAMVEAAITSNALFELSRIELERGGLSYTVDSLRELHRRHSEAALCLIVGMDSLVEVPRWRDPRGILRLAEVAAVYRPGWKVVDLDQLEAQLPGAASRVRIVPIPWLDISARELRERVRAGRSIRYLVPDAVDGYIAEHGLYRDPAGPSVPSPLAGQG